MEKRRQAITSLSKSRTQKPLKTDVANDHIVNFDDVKIHYATTKVPVQMRLKITDEIENPDYELSIDDVDELVDRIYSELERVSSRDEVMEKVQELIRDDKLYSYERFNNFIDYLYQIFPGKSSSDNLSDEVVECAQSTYTGVLSQDKRYHRIIKPAILKTIGKKTLQQILGYGIPNQHNFDFYIRNGRQLWVSGNHSSKPEKDTGYDIIFYQGGSYTISKRIQ